MENVRRISLVGGGHRQTKSGVSISNVVGGGGELVVAGDVPGVAPVVIIIISNTPWIPPGIQHR